MPSATRTRFFATCLGVFQGGGCRAAALAGAVSEARKRGVDFAGVAGTSAGSIVAALLGAGASAGFLTRALEELDFVKLLRPPETISSISPSFKSRIGARLANAFVESAGTLWKHHGRYSSAAIEDWLNEQLRALLPESKKRVLFRDLPIPTYVVAADVVTHEVKVWSSDSTPEDEVAFAVRCSCSIPGFFQPVQGRYIDGGVLSNLPAFVFAGREFASSQMFANRILAFALVAKYEARVPADGWELLEATVNTIVDGASELQERLLNRVHQILIPTGEIKATDFEKMNKKAVEQLLNAGKAATAAFFDDELSRVESVQQRTNLLKGQDEIYAAVTEALDETHITHVVISDNQTKWAYSIFPTLLSWRTRGVRIQVILNSEAADPHELYRRRLLRALGTELSMATPIRFRGFLLNPDNEALARAITIVPEAPGVEKDVAVIYQGQLDFPAIQALWSTVKPLIKEDINHLLIAPTLSKIGEDTILEKLRRRVKAYATATARLSVETVPLKSIVLMTRIVRGYKFKQIAPFAELFQRDGIALFDAAEVRYSDTLSTIATPPVVEFSGERYILVQGNTRALYCYKYGQEEIRCIVVRDHTTPLPSSQRVELREVLIGDRTISTEDRYGGDIDRDYRSIEWATHHPEETLLSATV